MRTPTAQNWRRVERIGVPVVIATQRESGLWALPCSDLDRGRLWAKPGTHEAIQRRLRT